MDASSTLRASQLDMGQLMSAVLAAGQRDGKTYIGGSVAHWEIIACLCDTLEEEGISGFEAAWCWAIETGAKDHSSQRMEGLGAICIDGHPWTVLGCGSRQIMEARCQARLQGYGEVVFQWLQGEAARAVLAVVSAPPELKEWIRGCLLEEKSHATSRALSCTQEATGQQRSRRL